MISNRTARSRNPRAVVRVGAVLALAVGGTFTIAAAATAAGTGPLPAVDATVLPTEPPEETETPEPPATTRPGGNPTETTPPATANPGGGGGGQNTANPTRTPPRRTATRTTNRAGAGDGGGGGGLANTGFDAAEVAGLGALLTAAGATLVFVARRRRDRVVLVSSDSDDAKA